jgi:hypothetical protein
MDIMDLPPLEMQRLANHRYYEHLKQLHLLTRERTGIPVYLLESLEQARQVLEMANERVLAACGLAPNDDQLALPLEPGA